MKRKNDNNKQSYIFTRETLGMTILLFCALMLLVLVTYNTVFSSFGAAICAFMYGTFGYGSYLVTALFAYLGFWLVFEKNLKVRLRTAVVFGTTIFMVFLLFHAVTTRDYPLSNFGEYLSLCYKNAELGYAGYSFGGVISALIVYPIARGTTFAGAYVIFAIMSALCIYLCVLVVKNDRAVRSLTDSASKSAKKVVPVAENTEEYAVPDKMYSVNDDYEIVNNRRAEAAPAVIMQPEQRVEAPAEDKFSDKNLGRRILFENGEFAAESYRRNMIFNDDSYFNHPVQNDEDYLSSFSSGKPANKSQPVQNQTYTSGYSSDIENSSRGYSTPSYVYGDKPADSLDFYGSERRAEEDVSSQDDDYKNDNTYISANSFDNFSRRDEHSSDELHENDKFAETDSVESKSFDGGDNSADDLNVSSARTDYAQSDFSRRSTENYENEDNSSSQNISAGRSFDRSDGDEISPFARRVQEGAEDGQNAERTESRQDNPSNNLRNLFSASNENISSDIQPDASRLNSRRCESRANLFDGEDDSYLSDDVPDLGTRGLRPADDSSSFGSREDRTPSVPERRREMPVEPTPVPVRRESQPAQEKAVEPEKPKHVWKKYVRPTLELLADYPENNNANIGEIEENKSLIVDTLSNFRIASHISDVIVGPAITRYDVIIEDKTNIKSALRYREAIAMALMKENVTAYLNYSKGAISIEVPNNKRTVVGLKTMLTSSQFINCKPNSLTFALGKNVEGKPNCPDITKMPHLLVAGTTGSGKSICLSALIISLLYKYGPDELRFILVDPKQSEFISYEGLPHLIINEIISDVDKAIKALNWAIKEMERRYTLFKEMTLSGTLVKNINEYNQHLPEGEEKLPKIVIILDEFGDLMLQAKKDIESRIIRLVQKSRACGIHLILATQRPSVDCITGLIKSNLPTRIGFKVNSFDDSRTIFDIGGAEKLLGAGDMYFRSAENPDLARIQGCFIDSPEVQAVTEFVKKNNETYFDQSVSDFINKVEEEENDAPSDDGVAENDVKIDDKFIQALKFCVVSNQASVSMLQRRFPIGYVKACKIIDWMENMNYITQSEGSKPRKVLLSLDEFTRIYGDIDD